jgi:hypothetical protein
MGRLGARESNRTAQPASRGGCVAQGFPQPNLHPVPSGTNLGHHLSLLGVPAGFRREAAAPTPSTRATLTCQRARRITQAAFRGRPRRRGGISCGAAAVPRPATGATSARLRDRRRTHPGLIAPTPPDTRAVRQPTRRACGAGGVRSRWTSGEGTIQNSRIELCGPVHFGGAVNFRPISRIGQCYTAAVAAGRGRALRLT